MAISYNFIQVQPNSTGLKLATVELVQGTNTVEQQIVTLGDPQTAANQAAIVAKGNQGTFGIATQDLKDSGRVSVCLGAAASGIQALTGTEAFYTFTLSKAGNAQLTGQTSYTLTTGKTFRIQAIIVNIGNAVISTYMNIRVNSSGAATLTSNVLLPICIVSTTAYTTYGVAIPDGLEIPAGGGFCIGVLGNGAFLSLSLVGYEY